MSRVIERHPAFYPLYKAATRQAAVRAELGKVVTEEQSHRRDIEETCLRLLAQAGVPDLSAPRALEERLFDGFLTALESSLPGQSADRTVRATAS